MRGMNARHRACCFHDSSVLCAVTAIGDDDGEHELPREHLAAWLCRQHPRQCQRKSATRARLEGTMRPRIARPFDTGTTTSGNSDRSAAAAATVRRRTRREVRGRNTRPRRIRSGSASTRILTNYGGMMQEAAHRRRVSASHRRLDLLIDRLLQAQRRRINQQRSEPRSQCHLSSIIGKLLVNDGHNWSRVMLGGANPPDNDRQKSHIASDKIFIDKRASYRRRPTARSISDLPEQLRRNMRPRRRPPIDPMLLMVGIGRK